MSRGQRAFVAAGAVAALFCVAVLGWIAFEGVFGGDEPEEGIVAVIDNRVTSGMEMREDDAPACLTETPRNYCQDVVVTDLWSGDEITLTCQTTGERTTNGNDSEPGDNNNPELYDTGNPGLWYGARHEDGRGLISEVWVEDDARGGLGLPRCK